MSTQAFADLGVSPAVLTALGRRGITTPFAIQTLVIADVLAGRDVLAKSTTGSGKTLAFGIPLVERIDANGPKKSAFMSENLPHSSGSSSSGKIASTGHSGTPTPQSMHSCGSMKYMSAAEPVWIQSTGQTSAQLPSFTPTHGSATWKSSSARSRNTKKKRTTAAKSRA